MVDSERATSDEPRATDYAVIGWPLGHSMSPVIHNASFRALGLGCRFEARPVPPSGFAEFIKSLPSTSFGGLAVTIPYKSEILGHCRERDETVRAIGAANTVRVGPDGGLEAFNTDAGAASRTLREAGVDPEGARVVVLGAGGAARAICFRMLRDGAAAVTIANRTFERAERLREEMGPLASPPTELNAVPLERDALAAALGPADILINTTSVGMYPRVDESPVPAEILKEGLAVFDIVYNPRETLLLRAARERGGKTIGGTDMLVYQAAEQEKLWLGVDAPVETMRESLLSLNYSSRSDGMNN